MEFGTRRRQEDVVIRQARQSSIPAGNSRQNSSSCLIVNHCGSTCLFLGLSSTRLCGPRSLRALLQSADQARDARGTHGHLVEDSERENKPRDLRSVLMPHLSIALIPAAKFRNQPLLLLCVPFLADRGSGNHMRLQHLCNVMVWNIESECHEFQDAPLDETLSAFRPRNDFPELNPLACIPFPLFSRVLEKGHDKMVEDVLLAWSKAILEFESGTVELPSVFAFDPTDVPPAATHQKPLRAGMYDIFLLVALRALVRHKNKVVSAEVPEAYLCHQDGVCRSENSR